jgi:4-diphosphocytidyl-2C-methyl-D-erythritol kinase
MATVMSDTGSTFSAYFETEDDAEEFAEQWVIK